MTQRDEAARDSSPRPHRRRQWRNRRWLVALLPLVTLAATVVWLAPTIVANTPLRQKIVSAVLADFEGRVTVGSASLGWFSPLAAYDIAAVDRAGLSLGRVKSVQSERTLLGLLTDRRQLGEFRLEQPAVHVVLRPGGSNWEDAVAAYLQPTGRDSSVDQIRLQVVGAVIEVRDTATGAEWRVEGLDAGMKLAVGSAGRVQIEAAGDILAAGGPPSRGSVRLDCQLSGTEAVPIGAGQLEWQVDELPLGPWNALLERAGAGVDMQGRVSSRGRCGWAAGLENVQLSIEQLRGQSIAVRAPHWLGADVFRSREMELRGQVRQAAAGWNLDDVHLTTDFARISASGSLPSSAAGNGSWSELARTLQEQPLQASGRLQLKEVAGMFPHSLRIRQGTQITSGALTFKVASQAGDEPGFTARLDLADLSAVEDGRTMSWKKPMSAAAEFRYTADGPVVDRLALQTEFLEIDGQGRLSGGSAIVRGRLDRLQQELGRFVDLGQLELSGQLDGTLRWQVAEAAQLKATGRLALSDFRFDLPGSESRPWQEQSLVIDLSAAAEVADQQIASVSAASLQLRSGNDRWSVQLLRPVARPWADAAWPLQTQIAGRLETWLPRLQPIWNSAGWQLSGSLALEATATADAQQVRAEKVQLQLGQFHAVDPGRRFVVDEPAVRLETAATWELNHNRLSAADVVLTSSTLAFRAQQVHLQLPAEATADRAVAAGGRMNYRADLGRLTRCFLEPGRPPTGRFAGTVTGAVDAAVQGGATQVDWTADVQDLVYTVPAAAPAGVPVRTVSTASGWRELWREPSVQLAGKHRFDPARDHLTIDTLTAAGASWKLAAAGRLERLSAEVAADLKGTLDYDLAELTRQLQPTLGTQVKLVGRQQAHFTARGPLAAASHESISPAAASRGTAISPAAVQPLVPRQLAGTFGFGWDSGNAFGMELGAAEAGGTLREAILRMHPLDVAVSGGRVTAAPAIDLNVQPVRLNLDRGPLVDRVLISPEMCQSWLKYVAPLLAEATRAEGRFSVNLDGGSLPLIEPHAGSTAGVLTIHAGRVGPGPLARQFLSVARQVKMLIDGRPGGGTAEDATWLSLPEQQVKFDVRDGRVQHQGLTVAAGDVLMRTSGTVGFDQTLALVAEVPVQDQWIAGKRLLEPLKGTSLQVPIRGTFSQPQIDSRALADLNRQIMQNAAGRAVEEELGRGLQRLLGPRP